MRTCKSIAEFGVRGREGSLTSCPRHLPDAVSKVGQAVVDRIGTNHGCQVPERFPFGFCSPQEKSNHARRGTSRENLQA